MAAIIIAGVTLSCSDGGEGDPLFVGSEEAAFAGNLRNSIRGQKRTFSGTTAPTLAATWDTLRAAIANRTHVTVSGEILSGDSITAAVSASIKWETGTAPAYGIITFNGRQV